MLPALIVVPSLILAGLLFVFLPTDYSWIFVIPLSIGVGAFIIRRGLDEWWYSKFPPRLAAIERDILHRHFPYYRFLNADLQADFERRVAVFRMLKLFQMRGAEKLPGDIQLLVSATAIQLTMGFPYQREYYHRLAAIILFPRTFITPEMNRQLHAVELHRGEVFDSLFLAVNVYIDSLKDPRAFYQTGIYGFAKEFRLERGIRTEDIPGGDNPHALIAALLEIRGFDANFIAKFTAMDEYELFELLTEQFFTFPETLRKHLPEAYDFLVQQFRQDPSKRENPIV